MHTPVSFPPPRAVPEPPGIMRFIGREDVIWNRPVFKAPPLTVHPKRFDLTALADEFRRIGLREH